VRMTYICEQIIYMSLSANEPLIIGLVCESTAPHTHIDTQMHLGLICIQAHTGMFPERECVRTRVCTRERERVRARTCLRTCVKAGEQGRETTQKSDIVSEL